MNLLQLNIFLLTFFSLGRIATANTLDAERCISTIPKLTFFTQSTSGYRSAALPFNRRFTPSPAIIAIPDTISQIQSIVQCAGTNNVTVSAKSGGHSYAAYGLSGTIVVDMSNMKSFTLNSDNTAVVGTGTSLGDLSLLLFNQGGRALPHGSCPYVGVGGHTLYGGFGSFARIGGLLLDTVVSADVILANGGLVTLNSTSHVDLFTAIRGGGPSFGLVVSWTYQTLPAPSITARHDITFQTALTINEATAVYLAWQSFVQDKPDEFAAVARFTSAPQGSVNLELSGNYYGSVDDAFNLISPFLEALPSDVLLVSNFSLESLGWIEGLEAVAGGNGNINTSLAPDSHDTFYAKSLITTAPITNETIEAFVSYLATNGSQQNADTDWFVQVDLYGGRIARVDPKTTSFDHRSAFLVYQFYASSPTLNPPYPSDGVAFVDGIVKRLSPEPASAPPGYPNYIDPLFVQDDLWKQVYFPTKSDELQSIKERYDPLGVFDFPEGFQTVRRTNPNPDSDV